MGTLAKQAAAAGYEVVLVSADKDLMQLVAPGVSLFHTGRGKRYDPAEVEKDYGLPPRQDRRLPGAHRRRGRQRAGRAGHRREGGAEPDRRVRLGRGAARARRRDLAQGATARGSQNHREQALLSKELVTIHTDLPVELHPESLAPRPARRRGAARALRRARVPHAARGARLRRRAPAAVAAPARGGRDAPRPGRRRPPASPDGSPSSSIGGDRPGGGGDRGRRRRRRARRPAPSGARRRRAGDARRAGRPTPASSSPGTTSRRSCASPPAASGRARGSVDLMLASYLLRSSAHGHSLEEIADERAGRAPRSAKEAGFDKGHEPPVGDARARRARRRAAGAARARWCRRPSPSSRRRGGSAAVYREIEAPLVPVLLGMEETGIGLDCRLPRRDVGRDGRRARDARERRSTRSPASAST